MASNEAVSKERRVIADRVIDRRAARLRSLRLTILLDGSYWLELKENAPENRGMFRPVSSAYLDDEPIWPSRLLEKIAVFQAEPWAFEPSCDAAIYLHDRTCQSIESLTMTLAHELQHAIQYGAARPIWAINTVVTNLPKELIEKHQLQWSDIPIEREARIFAKRVCEEVIGSDRTAQYIRDRIAHGTVQRDVDDWKFIEAIDTKRASNYDLSRETHKLLCSIESCRPALEDILNGLPHQPEFADLRVRDILKGV